MMPQEFDKTYWEKHWQRVGAPGDDTEIAPNPHLAAEISDLAPGTALDAGCGEGAEARWLAAAGWQVTAVDISGEALARAARRADRAGVAADRLRWVEADLGSWQPGTQFDLVTTHYAHPAMPQLDFYQRISGWVRPGGTLLIVGHLNTPDAEHQHDAHQDGHGHQGNHGHENDGEHPPEEATVTAAGVTAVLDDALWEIATATEQERSGGRADRSVQLRDVVVRATRRA